MLSKGSEGSLELTWSPSCRESDADYEVYEGPLGGGFDAHAPIQCSTSGNTASTIAPAPGNRYYLVVPRGDRREGSHGQRSDGTERAQGPEPCMAQKIERCR